MDTYTIFTYKNFYTICIHKDVNRFHATSYKYYGKRYAEIVLVVRDVLFCDVLKYTLKSLSRMFIQNKVGITTKWRIDDISK